MITKLIIAITICLSAVLFADNQLVKGYSLTEIDIHKYDASEDLNKKTESQIIVDKLWELGVRHVNLSPRATMTHPRHSELTPMTNPSERPLERQRYLRLIRYIHGKHMTVGIRPIFFVVDHAGKTPYVEILPDGKKKIWWHGNIEPEDPNKWFESYKTYLDLYLPLARIAGVAEFTLGAELYSMTVGIEDQWKKYPYGFPGQWLGILKFVRAKLSPGTRVHYDINFTDDKIEAGGLEQFGGEFARWKYRLADLANPPQEDQLHIWKTLAEFWTGLDAIGIDMYRSLATENQTLPSDLEELTLLLQRTSDRYASQIDNALFEIGEAVEKKQLVILKEIGFRSVDRGFINPFVYAGDTGELNLMHQAAAYEAIFRSFWKPDWEWFKGISFWDVSVDLRRHGPKDIGFSPLGKPLTENILKFYFL